MILRLIGIPCAFFATCLRIVELSIGKFKGVLQKFLKPGLHASHAVLLLWAASA
jgi:hypothetical protein